MKTAFRIAIPFMSGMIYVSSGFGDQIIFTIPELNWIILGAIAQLPACIFYYLTD